MINQFALTNQHIRAQFFLRVCLLLGFFLIQSCNPVGEANWNNPLDPAGTTYNAPSTNSKITNTIPVETPTVTPLKSVGEIALGGPTSPIGGFLGIRPLASYTSAADWWDHADLFLNSDATGLILESTALAIRDGMLPASHGAGRTTLIVAVSTTPQTLQAAITAYLTATPTQSVNVKTGSYVVKTFDGNFAVITINSISLGKRDISLSVLE